MALLNRLDQNIQSSVYANTFNENPTNLLRFDPLLSRIEAAAYTGFEPGTFATWDYTKRYDLQPVRFPNATRYRLSTLNSFADMFVNPE